MAFLLHTKCPDYWLYRRLFNTEVVVDIEIDEASLGADFDFRTLHKIPPGYKDRSKSDNKFGDLIIWKTILKIAEAQKKHLIFVSGDEKADWWHSSQGTNLYPRYELFEEYRRASEGKSFHIISFARLLELFGASDAVVQEIRKSETVPQIESNYKTLAKKLWDAAWLRQQAFNIQAYERQVALSWLLNYYGGIALERKKSTDEILIQHNQRNYPVSFIDTNNAPTMLVGDYSWDVIYVFIVDRFAAHISDFSANAQILLNDFKIKCVVGKVEGDKFITIFAPSKIYD